MPSSSSEHVEAEFEEEEGEEEEENGELELKASFDKIRRQIGTP